MLISFIVDQFLILIPSLSAEIQPFSRGAPRFGVHCIDYISLGKLRIRKKSTTKLHKKKFSINFMLITFRSKAFLMSYSCFPETCFERA